MPEGWGKIEVTLEHRWHKWTVKVSAWEEGMMSGQVRTLAEEKDVDLARIMQIATLLGEDAMAIIGTHVVEDYVAAQEALDKERENGETLHRQHVQSMSSKALDLERRLRDVAVIHPTPGSPGAPEEDA